MTARGEREDAALLELVQRQTFRYFWDFADPESGLARAPCGAGIELPDRLSAEAGSSQ